MTLFRLLLALVTLSPLSAFADGNTTVFGSPVLDTNPTPTEIGR